MNPRATSLATSFASRDRELLGTSPAHKNKEESLVLNNKVVPSRQRSQNLIGKKQAQK